MLQVSSNFSVVKTLLSEDEIFVRHVRQQEYMVTRLKKASAKHGKLIEKQVIVFDMKSVSMMADFMALRVFRRTLEVDQACYPERLRKMFLINTPLRLHCDLVPRQSMDRSAHCQQDQDRGC